MAGRRFMSLFTVAFLLVILAMATGIGAETIVPDGKRMCRSKSNRFHGPCARDSNCASVCEAEGFSGGDCSGLRRRCFCTKYC